MGLSKNFTVEELVGTGYRKVEDTPTVEGGGHLLTNYNKE